LFFVFVAFVGFALLLVCFVLAELDDLLQSDLRNSLVRLVVQCIRYALDSFPERTDFLTYGTSPFVGKLDGPAAKKV